MSYVSGNFDRNTGKGEALFCVAFPDELLTGKDFQWVAALAPSGELHADVVHRGTAVELVGNPTRREFAVVAPFAQFVVVETVGGCLLVHAGTHRE